jgi:hypothetical protein
MSNAKKCPSCGSERTQYSDDVGFLDCLECWLVFKCPLPELPEGYIVREGYEAVELWLLDQQHCLGTFADGVFFFNQFYDTDAPAVIAFLQGAR